MAGGQSLHQGVQGVTELATERGRMLGAIGVDLQATAKRVGRHQTILEIEFQKD